MSATIDERIVSMRFDNQQFEQGVRTTMGTLDELKQSLRFDGATKGLETIDKAANNVSFAGIAAGVESLQKKFSAFGIVGMRVFQNVKDFAMRFAKNTVGFVTESIIGGGKRRAMNIENAHFQLQGLLKDEEKVQAVMDDAMDSVDGTAYAYDEAAKAASQFAASGMEAGEEMQSSLRAITGVAAMTNSEYESISQIFTTVAGNGRLMGDQLLQLSSRGLNAAATIKDYFNGVNDGTIEASESVTAAIKEVSGGLEMTEGDIRDFVSEGKISFQMFSAALDDAFGEHAKKANETFTGAMANVKASLARIGAEFVSPLIVQNGPLVQLFNALRERINDVKANIGPLAKLFTDSVSSMANAAAKYLENLDLTKHFETFYNVVDILRNVLGGIVSVMKPIGQAFRDVFPPVTISAVADFTAKLKELTANFKLNDEDAENLRKTFQGLFAVLDIIGTVISAVVQAIFPMSQGMDDLGSGVLSVTGRIGEWLVSLDKSIKKSETLGKFVQKIGNIIGTVSKSIGEHVEGMLASIRKFADENIGAAAESRLKPFQKICEVAKAAMQTLTKAFEKAVPILSRLGGIIADTLGDIGAGLQKAVRGEGFDSLIDLMNGGLMVGIGTGLMNFIGHMQRSVIKATGMFANVNMVLSNVKTTLISYQAALKADVLMKIAKAIAVLAASLFVLALIDSNKLVGALAAISVLFGELAASMSVFDKTLGTKGVMNLSFAGRMMIKMSAAVLVLALALKKISDIDSDKLAAALVGVTVLIGELVAATLVLSKWGKKVETSAIGMVLFAEAINILAKAVVKLAQLDTEELIRGLVGVGVLLGELAAFMVAAKFGKFKVSNGLAIIGLAAALLILQKGVSDFGSMNMDIMKRGLLGVAVALTMITVATKLMPKNMVGIGIGLIGVAAALKFIGDVIADIGNLGWEEIGKGIAVLAASLAILAIALNAMKGTLGGAAAMLVMSAALAIFTPVMKALGSMNLAEIGKAILALAAAFAVLGIAGAVLSPMVPAILGLAGALALIGVAVAACGVGLLAFSAGLAALAVSGVAGVSALIAAFEILFVGIINVLADRTEAIANAIKSIVLAIVSVVVECAPAIVEGILRLGEEVLKSLAAHAPNIVTYLMNFLIGVINAVAQRLPELIQAVVNLLGALFHGVIDALKGVDTTVLLEGIAGIGLLSGIMLALSAVAGMIPSAMMGVLGIGAVIAEMALVLAAIGALAQISGLEWLISEGGDLLQEIGTAIGKFVGGIVGGFMGGVSSILPRIGTDLSLFMVNVTPFLAGISIVKAETLAKAGFLAGIILAFGAADLLAGIANFLTGGSSLPQVGTNLSQFMVNAMPFFAGIMLVDESVLQAAKNLAAMIVMFTAADLIQGVTSWITGGSSLAEFGEELAAFGPAIADFADKVKDVEPEAVEGAAAAGKIMADMAKNLPNSGGVLGWFMGENDMDKFGAQLVPFGEALVDYSAAVSGLDANAVSNSAVAGKAIAELASNLPNSGGVLGWFMGENDMDKFGTQLVPFGKAIKSFSDAVADIDADAVVASANAAKSVSELASNLPNSGGVLGWFMGENDMDDFGTQLTAFGEAMKDYAQEVEGINPETVTASANAAEALSKLANGLPNSGGIVSWFTGDNEIGKFGKGLKKFGSCFADFYDTISEIKTSQLNGVLDGLKRIAEFANSILDSNTSTMSEFVTSLEGLGAGGIESFVRALTDGADKAKKAAVQVVRSAIDGVKVLKSSIYRGFHSTGFYAAEGFANGINSGAFKAVAKAKDMAKAADEAARKELDVHSPSKVFAEIGGYVAEGFANGIHDNANKAAHSAEELARIGTETAREVAESLKSDSSVFADFVEKTDDGGKAVEITLEKAAEAFKSFRDSVKDSIKDATGVFDEFKMESDVTGRQLLVNLKSQIKGISDWASNIQLLAARGINEGLLKTLSDMGPSGAKYAHALVTMTDRELKELNGLYVQRMSLNDRAADEIAVSFLNGGKKTTNSIDITLKRTAEAFKELQSSVKQSLEGAMGVFDEFKVETDVTGKQLLKNLKSQIDGITQWAANIKLLAAKGINKDLLKVLADMGPSGAKYINALVTMSDKELKKMNKLYKKRLGLDGKAADEIAESFVNGGKKAAQSYAQGFIQGSEKMKKAPLSGLAGSMEKTMKKVSAILSWNYKDAVKNMKSSLDYGKGAFQQFVNQYLSSTKNITLGNKAIKAASKAITAYGKKLYEESEYYKEDTANLKAHKKSLNDLRGERTKLQKQLKKAQKSNTEASKKRVKTLRQELAANKKSIAEAKKQVKADEDEIAKHTKEVFNNLRTTLSESVGAFLDPLKIALETGVDLFQKFESNADLYEEDKKNLEQYQKSLKELEAERQKIQDEIDKYADQNTLAARKRVKELKAQLSDVESQIEDTKKNIEQAEDDMASHASVTVDSILENMQSQISGVKKWQQDLKSLASRGLSQGLLDMLKEMGVSGVDYVQQFMKMTNAELKKANSLFAESTNLTAQILIDNFKDKMNAAKNWANGLQKMAQMGFRQDLIESLGDMGVDGAEYVNAFISMTPEQVKQFNQEYADSLKLPDKVADQVISAYAYAGGQSIKGFTSALAKLAENGSDENAALVAMATEIGKVIGNTLSGSSQKAGKAAVTALAKGMKSKKAIAKDNASSVGRAALKGLKGTLNNEAGKTVAVNIVYGLRDGLKNGSSVVSAAATQVAKAAYSAAKKALKINSPSREFAELGEYTDAGFVEGIMSGEKGIYKKVTDVMQKAIEEMYAIINSDMDAAPTIRPVLDLTEIQNGIGNIGRMIDSNDFSGSVNLASLAAGGISGRGMQSGDTLWNAATKLQNALTDILNKPGIEQHNTFSITGGNPREIANEVSHILQQQIERRKAAWE